MLTKIYLLSLVVRYLSVFTLRQENQSNYISRTGIRDNILWLLIEEDDYVEVALLREADILALESLFI